MDTKLISKENTLKLINALTKEVKVLAPQKDEFGDIFFKEVKDSKNVILAPFKPLMPTVRELLFGQIKEMIRYKKESAEIKLEEMKNAEDTIFWGLPTCDINGLLYTDMFFMGREFCDSYYKEVREKIVLISVVCDTPPNKSCFCGSMADGPHLVEGFDLQLTPMGDDYFVEVGSAKGKKIIESNKDLFSEVKDKSVVERIWEEAHKKVIVKGLDKNAAIEKMDLDPIKETLFVEVSDRCISCGACNYVCPTCTCFNVIDVGSKEEGVRERVLDSCVFSGYFRMAGGHNPKEKQELRTKQRYYCKLLWDKEKYNDSGCVGCGRCLDSCPVDIDIKEVMPTIAAGGDK
ncbi:MAG: 4Fe-4S ferredoxin [Candidatus Saganbacteria bacterium]|uniref:4Fe-4S ferredoxin n=1 Tax=Candidatus Saganbacteria bacterium TaxID=2575572 RepID=A0A833L1S4_UNCSA|nr:MAG: 4Fe-4S ferredoxin [Candidatus Saganbacteria bacterium]